MAESLDEMVRDIVREEIALALEGVSPVVVPAPAPKPEPEPTAGPNPFVAWKAEGLTMYEIILWRLKRSPYPSEWDQAVAAGYIRPEGIQRTPGVDRTGFDLTGTEGGGLKRNELRAGQVYLYKYVPDFTGAAYWVFEVSPGANTATRIAYAGEWEELREWRRIDFTAVKGELSAISVMVNGQATLGTIVRKG